MNPGVLEGMRPVIEPAHGARSQIQRHKAWMDCFFRSIESILVKDGIGINAKRGADMAEMRTAQMGLCL